MSKGLIKHSTNAWSSHGLRMRGYWMMICNNNETSIISHPLWDMNGLLMDVYGRLWILCVDRRVQESCWKCPPLGRVTGHGSLIVTFNNSHEFKMGSSFFAIKLSFCTHICWSTRLQTSQIIAIIYSVHGKRKPSVAYPKRTPIFV